MSAISVNDLNYMDDEFIETEEPQGFSRVPDGDYTAYIYSARAAMSEDDQPIPRLEWEFIVIGGEYADRHLFRNNVLKDKQALGWLKKDLRACGVDVDDPAFRVSEFLVNGTEQLLDVEVDVTVKNKKYINRLGEEKEACNVYINGLADSGTDTASSDVTDEHFDFDEKYEEAQRESPTKPLPRSETRKPAKATSSRTSSRAEKARNPFKD